MDQYGSAPQGHFFKVDVSGYSVDSRDNTEADIL